MKTQREYIQEPLLCLYYAEGDGMLEGNIGDKSSYLARPKVLTAGLANLHESEGEQRPMLHSHECRNSLLQELSEFGLLWDDD